MSGIDVELASRQKIPVTNMKHYKLDAGSNTAIFGKPFNIA
jgi:hypothetical protein